MWHVAYCIPTFLNGHCIMIWWISFFLLTKKLLSNYRCLIILVHMISVNRTIGFKFFCHPVYAILSAHVKIIIIIFVRTFKNRQLWANHDSFPYIMNIVDKPQKFSPSNVLSYTVSQPYLTRFQWNLSYPLLHAYFKSTAIFRVILLFNITPQCILHSRVKDLLNRHFVFKL